MMINKIKKIVLSIIFLFGSSVALSANERSVSFSPYVDDNGAIILPAYFRSTWVHLGTWVVTSTAAAGLDLGQSSPGTGVHNVYTQPESLKDYKNNRRWRDGAVLIMEIRSLAWDDLPTGHVIVEGEPVKWLVMVKDAKGRFPGSPNWGDGWGWAFFKSTTPKINSSTNYKEDCLGCHEAAKASDLVFIQGYQEK